MTWALESFKLFHFNGLLLSKVYIIQARKVQRSYRSWNRRAIRNFERKQLVDSKLTEGIWEILTWALESFKNFHFNGFLFSKVYIFQAKKIQRSYLSWNWRGIKNLERKHLSFQNWHKEFGKFWAENFKVSYCFALNGFLWAKYIFFQLKMYIRVIFHANEEGHKIWRGIDFASKLT